MTKRKNSAEVEQIEQDEPRDVQTLVLGGTPYQLCWDLDELAAAEADFQAKGHPVNLLGCLPPGIDLQGVKTLFAAAIHKRHPTLSYNAARAVVTLRTLPQVIAAIHGAFIVKLEEAIAPAAEPAAAVTAAE